MPIGSHNMLTTAYGSPTCTCSRCMYAMTGALTPAATTFSEATAEAHSGFTRKMILDKRRHHSTSNMGTLVTTTTCVIDHTHRSHRLPGNVHRQHDHHHDTARFACADTLTLTEVGEDIDCCLLSRLTSRLISSSRPLFLCTLLGLCSVGSFRHARVAVWC